MPPNVAVASFIFGAILVLIALLGGGFELFGGKVSGNVGKPGRIVAAILGGTLMVIGLVNPFDRSGIAASPSAGSSPTTSAPGIAASSAPTVAQAALAVPSPTTASPPPTVTPSPSATQTPTPEPPTPTQECKPGCVLYQADWSHGPNGWPETLGWKTLNGMLLNDGSAEDYQNWISKWVPAPLQSPGLADYAVEAEIKLVKIPDHCWSYGLVARGMYQAGVNVCAFTKELRVYGQDVGTIQSVTFSPDTKWHTYRFELKGNEIKVLLDGAVMLEATNNRYLSGDRVGLWSMRTELNVRSFKIIKL